VLEVIYPVICMLFIPIIWFTIPTFLCYFHAVSAYYSTTPSRSGNMRESYYSGDPVSAASWTHRPSIPATEPDDQMRRRTKSYCHRPLPPVPVRESKRRCSISVPLCKRPLSHFQSTPPTLQPKEQVDPLSLQDNAFLYILSQVQVYPAEILAKLPLSWRRKLLMAVAPFRLYQLEKTDVGNGIDTCAIWEELGKLKNNVWASYLTDDRNKEQNLPTRPVPVTLNPINQTDVEKKTTTSGVSLRTRFVNYLSHLLLNEMNRDYACKRITELLHATHVDMLEESVANALIFGHINSLFMFIPPYCLVPFRCPNLTERELYWSLTGNKMLPTSLEVYTYNLDASPLWNQDVISQEMMRRMLTKVRHLRIYNHKGRTEQLKQVASAVTSSGKYKEPPSSMGSLKHLEIFRTDDQHLAAIAPFFSSPHGFSSLTSLTVSMAPLRFVHATTHLGSLLKNQLNSLQHLHLQGLSCCTTRNVIHLWDYMFFHTLAELILKQRFCRLELSRFKELPWNLAQMLLEANFRTVPSHRQELVFRRGSISSKGELPFLDENDCDGEEEYEEDCDDLKENQFYPAAEWKCLQHKCIHFDNMSIPMKTMEWFKSMDRLCVHMLEFHKVDVNPASSPIRITIGYDGIGYGEHTGFLSRFSRKQRPSSARYWNERDLKEIFVNHKNFECRLFKWSDVQVNFLMNV